MIPIASRLCQSIEGGHLSPHFLATEPAVSILQPITGCSAKSREQKATPLTTCSGVCIRN